MLEQYLASSPDIDEAYARVRPIWNELRLAVGQTLSQKATQEEAKRLGYLEKQKGATVVDSEDDMAVILDFALHDYRPDKMNAFERYARNRNAELDDDRRTVLKALTQARFTLLELERPTGAISIPAYDILYEEKIVIANTVLPGTWKKGTTLAGRVAPLGPFWMTTGASPHFDRDLALVFAERLRQESPETLSAGIRAMSTAERSKMARLLVDLTRKDPKQVLAALPPLPPPPPPNG